MNPLTKRATERSRCETRLNYVIAIAAGIILGVMFGIGTAKADTLQNNCLAGQKATESIAYARDKGVPKSQVIKSWKEQKIGGSVNSAMLGVIDAIYANPSISGKAAGRAVYNSCMGK